MARNKEIIVGYESRALARDEKQDVKNDGLQAEHDKNVAFASSVLMMIQIFMELCFEGCIAYIWYFFFRSYVERRRLQGIPDDDNEPPVQRFTAPLSNHSPTPPTNGQHTTPPIKNAFDTARTPIGFFTDAQKAHFANPPDADETLPPVISVQACTDLYREENTILHDDLYTVLHEYQRGGKNYFTPYTENQILSRIGQYERDIEQAVQKTMGEDIISNRRRWLEYWQAKLAELYQKQKDAGIR